VFAEQPELSTDTAQGELMLTILAGVAKFETRLRAERQAEGIKAAQTRGVKFGRKPKLDDKSAKLIRQLRGDGLSVPEIVQRTGIGRTSVYKVFQED
jgi:DNA invertase Pin-like site-specific DNA recombinase